MDRKEFKLRNECKRLQNLLDYKREEYSLLKIKDKRVKKKGVLQ